MTLDAKRLAPATALVTAALWLLCSLAVSLAPELTLTLTGHMVHANLSELRWSLSWGGVVMGLVVWTISTAVAAWFLAWAYNRLAGAGAA